MPIALIRGIGGAALGWGWLFATILVGVPGLDAVAFSSPRRASGILVMLGIVLGFALMLGIQRIAHRGPEVNRIAIFCVGVACSAGLFALTTWTSPATVWIGLCAAVLCLALGVCGSYALRRSSLLIDSASNWHYPNRAHRYIILLVIALGAVIALAFVRMDTAASCMFCCFAVPVALALLPQGRLSLTTHPQAGQGSSQAIKGSPSSQAQRLRASLSWAHAYLAGICVLGISAGALASLAPWGIARMFNAATGAQLEVAANIAWLASLEIAVFLLLVRAILMRPTLSLNAFGPALLASMGIACVLEAATLFALSSPDISPLAMALLLSSALASCIVPTSLIFSALAVGSADRGGTSDAKPLMYGCMMFIIGCMAGMGLTALESLTEARIALASLGIALCAVALVVCAISIHATALVPVPASGISPSPSARVAADGLAESLDATPEARAAQRRDMLGEANTVQAQLESQAQGQTQVQPQPQVQNQDFAQAAVQVQVNASDADSLEASELAAQEMTPEELRSARCADVAMRYGLSERQHDLLLLLYDGYNAQQVADALFISRNTAKTHMAHIYSKLNIHTRAELNEILGIAEADVDSAAHPVKN
jgi:DNA-binding CsgD family transcriptional regulator